MSLLVEFHINDKIRSHHINLLKDHFDNKFVKIIEEGIYGYTKQYCAKLSYLNAIAVAIYKDVNKNILFNCIENRKTIQEIKLKMRKSTFNPYNLAFLRPEELDEDNWIRIIIRKKTTEEKINNLPTVTWEPCARCNGTQYSYYQLQTRSVDEPVTTFYTCKECCTIYNVNL